MFKVLQPAEISVPTFKAKGWSFIERLWTPSWPRGRLIVASVPTDDCPCWRRRRLKPELPTSTTEGKFLPKHHRTSTATIFPIPIAFLRAFWIRYLTGDHTFYFRGFAGFARLLSSRVVCVVVYAKVPWLSLHAKYRYRKAKQAAAPFLERSQHTHNTRREKLVTQNASSQVLFSIFKSKKLIMIDSHIVGGWG